LFSDGGSRPGNRRDGVSIDACETAIDIFVKRHEAYFILAKIMTVSGDTETAKQIIEKGIEVCKSTVELSFALCALEFTENNIKEGEVQLRNLLESHYVLHELLFDFNEFLKVARSSILFLQNITKHSLHPFPKNA